MVELFQFLPNRCQIFLVQLFEGQLGLQGHHGKGVAQTIMQITADPIAFILRSQQIDGLVLLVDFLLYPVFHQGFALEINHGKDKQADNNAHQLDRQNIYKENAK